MQPEPSTYPPLDVPKPVADGVWIVDSGPLKAFGAQLPIRMTVLALQNGDLILHSPTRFLPALRDAIARLGTVRHLVAPNVAHWVHLEEWQRHCPDATVWAAPGLRDRGQVKRSRVKIDHDLADTAPAAWAGEVDQQIVRGVFGFAEVALFHTRSRTLVLTDLVQNFQAKKLPLFIRPVAAMLGVTHCKAPVYLRQIVKWKGAEPRAAAQRLLDWNPERVIFAHGDWFAEDAERKLRTSLSWLL